MTELERLVFRVADAVLTLLRNAEFPETAHSLAKVKEAYIDSRIKEPFEPAILALEDEGLEAVLEHTGGGIYVLYHYPTNSTSIRVGVTPWDGPEGGWLVCGYESDDDEGTTFMETGVSLVDLYAVVVDIGERIMTGGQHYRIPGEFYVKMDLNGPKVEFAFLPSAGSAGYFGPHAIDFETGNALPESLEEAFWDRLSWAIRDGKTTVTWEG